MRIGVIGAALCLCFVGICQAQSAHASIRKDANIPAEPLGSALQDLAKTYDLQLLYHTELAKDLRSLGASGALTSDEALTKVLNGTGLTYKYLDSNTVTIMPPATGATVGAADQSPSESLNGGGKKSSQDFRVAQVDQGKNSSASSVGQQNSSSQGNENSPSTGLSEIVVTAQKREERLQNVPISISVLKGSDLDQSTVQGVSEALNSVPGVATNQNYLGGGTTVTIRGVSANAPLFTGSSPVAYYLDSVPFGLVRSSIAPDSDVYDLQRVEVLRGPQGTLYGSSALNGVVRVLTNDADLSNWDFKIRASDSGTEYGGNNYRGDMAINVPLIEDKLAVRAVVGYESNSGWIDQPNKDNVNDTELRTYRLKINSQPTQDLSIGLSAWSSRENAGAPPVGYTFDRSASVLDQPISTDYDAYDFKLGYQLPWFTISSATSYLDYSNDGTLGLDVATFNAPGSLFISNLTSNVFSEEVNLNSSLEGAWRWSAGAIYRRGTEDLTQIFTGLYSAVPTTILDSTSKSYAVYGELTRLFLQGRLELTAGLRHFEDTESQIGQNGADTPLIPGGSSDGANTPRGVLTWHATDQVMAYASYSQGFRSGFPQNSSVLVDNPNFPALRPDRLTNYEVGSKGSSPGGAIAYDASIYYIDWRDIQQQLLVPFENFPAGVLAIVNGQAASGIGTDLALSVRPVESLVFKASVSWNDLKMDSNVISSGAILFRRGDRPNGSPETTAGASAEYLFGLGSHGFKGRVLASANYTSSQSYRTGPPLVIQTGDSMLFARASFSIDSPAHWTATIFADNINNERGTPVEFFPSAPNWYERVRPFTAGVQLDYHLR